MDNFVYYSRAGKTNAGGGYLMFEGINNNVRVLEKALDASWMRNEAISENLAHIDTPGYKRKTVEFEEHLNLALDGSGVSGKRTHKKHISVGRADVGGVDIRMKQDNKSLSMRLDGNNVDIDAETVAMAKNTIKYNSMTQSLNTEFRRLKSVINEGRR